MNAKCYLRIHRWPIYLRHILKTVATLNLHLICWDIRSSFVSGNKSIGVSCNTPLISCLCFQYVLNFLEQIWPLRADYWFLRYICARWVIDVRKYLISLVETFYLCVVRFFHTSGPRNRQFFFICLSVFFFFVVVVFCFVLFCFVFFFCFCIILQKRRH